MQKFNAIWEYFRLVPFFNVIAEHYNRLHAFAANLMRNIGHRERAIHWLAAGHRNGIVVQNFVGNIYFCSNRLTNCE